MADQENTQPTQREGLCGPTIVAYLLVRPDGSLSMDAVRHKPKQPAVAVMAVDEHAASVARWAEMFNRAIEGHGHVFPRADGVKMRCGGPGLCSKCTADASLVHPCPAHPAVEQAGGDARKLSDLGNELHNLSCSIIHENEEWAEQIGGIARELWNWPQARAALAHDEQEQAAHELRLLANALGECIQAAGITAPGVPLTGPQLLMFAEDLKRDLQRSSLAQPSPKCNCPGFEKESLSSHAPNCPVRASTAQPSPAQAEVERPEVVAHVDGTDEDWFIQPEDETEMHNEGLLFSGCELGRMIDFDRIVGELRADRDSWAEQAEQRLADWDEMRKERDAALVEVERLRESKGDPVGSLEKCMKVMYERDEHAKRLEVAMARVAELEAHCVRLGQGGAERYWENRWRDADARLQELEKQEPVATVAKVPGEDWNSLDFHRDLQDMQPGTKLYTAPVAQAQHSVPEISGIGRDAEHPRAVVLYLRNEPSDEDMRAIQNFLRAMPADVSAKAQHSVPEGWKLVPIEPLFNMMSDKDHDTRITAERQLLSILADAPGNLVPQAWLDVQAERRRQITAEGWTPEHDDLYCAAELPRAAAAYILNGANDEAPAIWPFSAKWWKPRDARSNYVRAGALILAEIERLDRARQGGRS
uniref:Uncharacterized protein n=1 Tax=Pseudomonas phage PA_L9 TaxID=3232177 RepID=A0AAU8L051_9CAUD